MQNIGGAMMVLYLVFPAYSRSLYSGLRSATLSVLIQFPSRVTSEELPSFIMPGFPVDVVFLFSIVFENAILTVLENDLIFC